MLIRLIISPADENRSGANQMRQHLSFREHFRRGNAASYPDCRATDRRLDIGGAASVVEIEAERGQYLVRAEMHGQHLIGADDAWCHLGDALDFGAHLRVDCLTGEEALTFIWRNAAVGVSTTPIPSEAIPSR